LTLFNTAYDAIDKADYAIRRC